MYKQYMAPAGRDIQGCGHFSRQDQAKSLSRNDSAEACLTGATLSRILSTLTNTALAQQHDGEASENDFQRKPIGLHHFTLFFYNVVMKNWQLSLARIPAPGFRSPLVEQLLFCVCR